MSLQLITTLESAGLTPEQIVASLKKHYQEKLLAKREKGRERSRRFRLKHARNAGNGVTRNASNGVTKIPEKIQHSRNGVTRHRPPLPYLLKESESVEGGVGGETLASRVTRGTRLSDDWRPSPDDVAWARKKGVADQKIKDEFEKFQNYWLAKAGKDAAKLEWGLTFRNWVARSVGGFNGRHH